MVQTFAEDAGRGSEQERAKLDKLYALQLDASRAVSLLSGSSISEVLGRIGRSLT